MYILLAVIALIGFACFEIETAFRRKNHKRYSIRTKKPTAAQIKWRLDELLKAHNQGLVGEAEYEQKCDELIDNLADHIATQP
nr:hypothetical protein [uncultured Dyadobacter sp.]